MRRNKFPITRLLVLTNIIAPYRIPFFNILARNNRLKLFVIYIAENYFARGWLINKFKIKYSYKILKNKCITFKRKLLYFNFGFRSEFTKFQPDIIVIGTDILNTPLSWYALFLAKIKKIKIIRFEGRHHFGAKIPALKQFLYKQYYKHCDAFFVYSKLTEKYLLRSGVKARKIANGYNVGDTAFYFIRTRAYISSAEYKRERNKLPEVLFLFCGELDCRKNIIGLLEALQILDFPDVGLFVLGKGILELEVRNFAKKFRNLRVFIEGFKQQEECVKYFSLADIFVLPSRYDPASIVLSEALCSGLFTIGSKYDGSSHNFIRSGENGFIIDPLDQQMLRKSIEKAYMMKKSGKISKEKIRRTMSEYIIQKYALRLKNLVEELVSSTE